MSTSGQLSCMSFSLECRPAEDTRNWSSRSTLKPVLDEQVWFDAPCSPAEMMVEMLLEYRVLVRDRPRRRGEQTSLQSASATTAPNSTGGETREIATIRFRRHWPKDGRVDEGDTTIYARSRLGPGGSRLPATSNIYAGLVRQRHESYAFHPTADNNRSTQICNILSWAPSFRPRRGF